MSKFTNLLLTTFAIQLGLIITGLATIPGDVFFQFLIDPSTWGTNTLMILFDGLFTGLAGVTLVIGLIFFKSDFIVFAAIIGTLFSFGMGIYNLFAIISAQLNPTIEIGRAHV